MTYWIGGDVKVARLRSPLRVVFVTESLEAWGAEQTLLTLCRASVDLDVDVTILCSPKSPLLRMDVRGARIVPHDFARHPVLERNGSLRGALPSDYIQEVLATARGVLLARRAIVQADVVVGFSLWQVPEFLIAAHLRRKPFVLDIHDDFDSRASRTIVKLVAKLSRLVISPSRHLLKQYDLAARARAAVIPRPVEMVGAPPTVRVDGAALTVGIFGQISPHKQVDIVVDAAERLGFRLLVVGGRPRSSQSDYEKQIRARVAQLPADSEVIERLADIRGVLAQCDVVVNVSSQEAFGRTIVEALSAECLPIVMQDSGPAEIVRSVGYGLVMNSLDELDAAIGSSATYLKSTNRSHVEDRLIAYRPDVVAEEYFARLRSTLSRLKSA